MLLAKNLNINQFRMLTFPRFISTKNVVPVFDKNTLNDCICVSYNLKNICKEEHIKSGSDRPTIFYDFFYKMCSVNCGLNRVERQIKEKKNQKELIKSFNSRSLDYRNIMDNFDEVYYSSKKYLPNNHLFISRLDVLQKLLEQEEKLTLEEQQFLKESRKFKKDNYKEYNSLIKNF